MSFLFHQLKNLRLGVTPYGKAPHKPILLLAVIEGFEKGWLMGRNIVISDELLTAFHDYWNLLVDTRHVPNFSLPFFHLGSEPSGIWELKNMPGKTIPVTKSNSIKSFKALRETVQSAVVSEEFFQALSDAGQRKELKEAILEYYFQNTAYRSIGDYSSYSDQVKSEILYDPEANYASKVIQRFEQMQPYEKEEEIIVRSNIFKKAVLELYDHRCAISGLQIETPDQISMVDACHIIPFAESYDDTIRNGITLAPTIHRAFDRGLITISSNYQVVVHSKVKDHSPSTGIAQFNQKKIYLPKDSRFYPSKKKLQEHWKRFSFFL